MAISRKGFIKNTTLGVGGMVLGFSGTKLGTMLEASELKQGPRRIIGFDFDWKFFLGDTSEAKSPEFDDDKWQDVQLPHDWSIKTDIAKENAGEDWMASAMGYRKGGIGWYRKIFQVPENYQGKNVRIQFGGVYHQSDIYINGQHLGFHPYGYTSFEYDLTPYLDYGEENVIAVRVDHSDFPSSRWYSGSGIYRHVWLSVTNPVHVATWGTYITTTNISERSAEVNIATTVKNEFSVRETIVLQNRVIDVNGNQITAAESSVFVGRGKSQEVSQTMDLNNPKLWSIDEPNLYTMETTLKINDEVIDQYQTPFGIREIRFDANRGFFLNGENIKLKGMCLHFDMGSLGTAVPDQSYFRRLKILKEYGCNAIRCSHHPPPQEFLDMCDRLGFVVIDESFDKWKSMYYEKYFDEWWQKDMDAMLLRDRNHPSVIMWSIGNETEEQFSESSEGTDRAIMLRDYVHEVDPTRPVTAGIRPGAAKHRIYNENGFTEVLDIVGYNYQEPWLLDDKKKFPDRIMYVSEAFPYYRGRNDDFKDFYPINPWYDVAENDFVFGQFIWVGVDYLGESSGWPSTGWPTGLFDVCMTEKPKAAFHRSVWNEEPMVRIAAADQSLDLDPGKPHWSWPFLADHWNFPQYAGHVIEVHTTTNCDSVELWLNGESLGRRNTSEYTNNTIVWHVPYEQGEIQAKGYIDGKEVAEYELTTTEKPAQLALSADRNQITEDGQDVSHITIELVDEEDRVVPDEDQAITLEVEGEGRLLGLDNGDLRVDRLRNGNTIDTYLGKALAIVQSNRSKGNIKVKVSSKGLPESSVTLISK